MGVHRSGRSTVSVPGSKSIANRALICAALAEGTSTLRMVPDGDDTAAMLTALASLGVRLSVEGPTVTVGDAGELTAAGGVAVDARLAGTTSRFLTAYAALDGRAVTVDGEPPLRTRPMGPLHDALRSLGAEVTPLDRPGHLPVKIRGGHLAGGTVRLAGDVSSQFVSALMLIGPRLGNGLTIELTTRLVSRRYVEITGAVMAAFGADGVKVGERTISVGPGIYRARDYTVEPDASSASYPWAAAAITGGSATVAGLGPDALQGDVGFLDVLTEMGCTVEYTPVGTTVNGPTTLRGVDVDMGGMSDLVPTLAAVALFAATPTTIRGVGFIRTKESDRLGDLATELAKLGAVVTVTGDGLVISPRGLHGAALAAHHDHRLAMAFGLISLRVPGIEIDDPTVVTKSWPEYWTMLTDLRSELVGAPRVPR